MTLKTDPYWGNLLYQVYDLELNGIYGGCG